MVSLLNTPIYCARVNVISYSIGHMCLLNDYQKMNTYKKDNGVALITALLIVSLATIMAVSLVSQQYMDVRRTGNIMTSDKAYLQAITMETSAAHLLKFSRETLGKKYDNKKEFDEAVLGLNASAMQVSEGEAGVSLELVYPEAKFNVNTLLDANGGPRAKQQARFRNLLVLILDDLGESSSLADNLIDTLLDWIDENDNERSLGAEDGIYESMDPPYKAANQPILSISELKLVEGFSEKILYGIPKDLKDPNSVAIPGVLHFVTALPGHTTKMNINLITESKLIRSLSAIITEAMAQDIISDQPFENIGDFYAHSTWDGIRATANSDWVKLKAELNDAKSESVLDVQSSFFVAKSTATLGKSIFSLNSLVSVGTAAPFKIKIDSRAVGTDGI